MVLNKTCIGSRVSLLRRLWRMDSHHTTTPLTMGTMPTILTSRLPQRQENARRKEHRRLVICAGS